MTPDGPPVPDEPPIFPSRARPTLVLFLVRSGVWCRNSNCRPNFRPVLLPCQRFRALQGDFQAGGVSGVGMGERHCSMLASMLARRATIRARQHSASNASNMSRAAGGQYWDLA